MKRLLLVTLAAVLVALTGCGDEPGQVASSPGTAPAATLTVYFPDAGGERLVAEERPLPAGADPLAVALAELAAGPRAAGAGAALPEGSDPRPAGVAAGVARVDLGPGFERGYPSGGSAAEIATLAPLVFTVTGLPGVQAVLLTVEGRAPEPPGAAFDLARPLSRADLPEDLLP